MPDRVELLQEIVNEKRAIVTATNEASDEFQGQMDQLQTLILQNRKRQLQAIDDIKTMNRLIADALGEPLPDKDDPQPGGEIPPLGNFHEDLRAATEEESNGDPITLLPDEPIEDDEER